MEYAVFYQRLESERIRLHLSRKVVADCMGVESQTLIKYEKGFSSPTVSNVRKLKKLGFDIDFLCGIDKVNPISEITQDKYINTIDTIDKIANILGIVPDERQRLELGILLLLR